MCSADEPNSSMDFLQTHNLVTSSFFLILFSSSFFPLRADEYFVNCGSSSNFATNDGRSFVGDHTNHGLPGVKLFSAENSFAKKTEKQQPEPYQTAMVFSSSAAYQFKIIQNGTYILRLHFYASSSLSNARFNVSASGYMLLPNYRPNLGSIVIEEFLFTINTSEFKVYFIPSSSSGVAFVNAIELFLTPLKITVGSPVAVSSGIDTNLSSRVLHPIYRINFGGQIVPPSNDRLWRAWLPDDLYLQSNNSAKNGPIHMNRPNYRGGNATDYDAPDTVYNTAKELHLNSLSATWRFNVSRQLSDYLVRVHFCDMISEALGATVFNLFISSHFVWKIDPYAAAPYLAAPFYLDFVARSDEFGFMDIGIGSRNDTRITKNAFINGLEIMEIVSSKVAEPEVCEPGFSLRGIVAIVGLLGFGFALTYVIVSYVCADLMPKKVKAVEAFSHFPLVNLDEEEALKARPDQKFKQSAPK